MICCVAILGMLALRPGEVRAASIGTVCEPISIEICSICGENYHDSDKCPHHVGEMYDGTICDPNGTTLCSVCHEDWSSCPHKNGETYGGTICTTYRSCDICGGNYDDANDCPHHEGEAYGGTECSTYTILICNICGNNYENGAICSHVHGMVYEEGECVPFDRRICTICGNDYDNGGVCPHHIGEYYDQRVCTITRICRICGGNYDDGSECPHHEGERYGGTVCYPYEGLICNICGFDYNIGEICSHHVGEMYGGQTCGTYPGRECNICHKDYDNPNVCGHKEGQSYLFTGCQPLNDFVISVGYGGLAGFGIGGNLYGGYALDEEGNFIYLRQLGFEASTPALGAGKQIQITNAKSLDSLTGWGVDFGASATISDYGTGLDFICGKNSDGTPWEGVIISLSANNALVPFEVHGGFSYTWRDEAENLPFLWETTVDIFNIIYNVLSSDNIEYVNSIIGMRIA